MVFTLFRNAKRHPTVATQFLFAWLIGLQTLAGLSSAQAQGNGLTTQHQQTLLQYCGPKTSPLVAVALLSKEGNTVQQATEWLSLVRKQPVMAYSFQPKSEKYIGETEAGLDTIFMKATAANALLFFDEADALFGKPNPSTVEKALANKFLHLAKKPSTAVLVHCSGETSYFALAKGGLGIVSLD